MRPIAALLLLPAAASAQTGVGPHRVTTPGVRVDARGVRTTGATVDGSSVRAGRPGDAVTILTDHGERSVDCGGRSLSVQGDGNHLAVANCPHIEVLGNGNRLTARFVSAASLSVQGNDDTLTIHMPRQARFTSSVTGTHDHVVARGD